jgi:hypothetical protein
VVARATTAGRGTRLPWAGKIDRPEEFQGRLSRNRPNSNTCSNSSVVANPSLVPVRPAAWYVVTDQGVRLAGPHPTREQATAALTRVVENLRTGMLREQFPGEQIAARIRAVRVAHGVLTGPHQQFRPSHPDGP